MESQITQRQSLEGCAGAAKKKLADREKTAMELGTSAEGQVGRAGDPAAGVRAAAGAAGEPGKPAVHPEHLGAVPRKQGQVEDGNNFGASIPEDTPDLLWRFSPYSNTRAKLVCKIVEHPQVEDYLRTIAEVDENESLSVRQICCTSGTSVLPCMT
ncbi:Proteasome activator complex subunit 3 [Fukomys damarensis]|uniref:Proteasome activator complex subunit 3 n=1 Tax=Fukomys damarensis TaxID=885580 RepID=A0A091D4Z2_FUKDA|nr:Proteasome activator complex subunit 3 [Fukomys damarensis]